MLLNMITSCFGGIVADFSCRSYCTMAKNCWMLVVNWFALSAVEVDGVTVGMSAIREGGCIGDWL